MTDVTLKQRKKAAIMQFDKGNYYFPDHICLIILARLVIQKW